MKPNEGFNEVQLHLLAMSALLRDPKSWRKGLIAVDRSGRNCEAKDPDAVQWCLLGALERTYTGGPLYAAHIYLEQAIGSTGPGLSIPGWNDSRHRTHTEVQEALLHAVVLAGEWVPA